jgi:hypothetical protein
MITEQLASVDQTLHAMFVIFIVVAFVGVLANMQRIH